MQFRVRMHWPKERYCAHSIFFKQVAVLDIISRKTLVVLRCLEDISARLNLLPSCIFVLLGHFLTQDKPHANLARVLCSLGQLIVVRSLGHARVVLMFETVVVS